MAKYMNAPVGFPVLALSRESAKLGDGKVVVGCTGGGGSAKSGVQNLVVLYSVQHNDKGDAVVNSEAQYDAGQQLPSSVEFSPDGKLLACSVSDGTQVLGFDQESRKLEHIAEFATDDSSSEPCQNIARFSPKDSRLIGTAGDDGSAALWRLTKLSEDTTTATPSQKPDETADQKQDEEQEQEQELDSSSGDEVPHETLERPESPTSPAEGEPELLAEAPSSPVPEVEKTLEADQGGISEKEEKGVEVRLEDTESSALVKDTEAEEEEEEAGAKEEDGNEEEDSNDFQNGWHIELVHKLKGHIMEVSDLAFNSSGTLVATASKDKTCRLWDVSTGKVVQLLTSDAAAGLTFRRCQFVGDDRLLTLQARIGRNGISFVVDFNLKEGQWELGRSVMVHKGLATTFTLSEPYLSVGDATGGVTILELESLHIVNYYRSVHSLPITGMSSLPNPDQPSKMYVMTGSMDKTLTMLPAKASPWRFVKKMAVPILLVLLVLIIRVMFFSGAGADVDAGLGVEEAIHQERDEL